ncbi:MAG: diaminopimelate epimerase [Gammaproteobacteria bacterium]
MPPDSKHVPVRCEFHKMHGAGNDFVLIDLRRETYTADASRIRALADRHLGVGCDQVLLLHESSDAAHLLRYEIWNADGTRAGQCGNGARCVALYIERNGEYPGRPFTLESPSGLVAVRRCDDGEYELDLGTPDFTAARVPLTLDADDGRYRLDSPWGPLEFGAVALGNPHALSLSDAIDAAEIPAIGAWLGRHEAFPEGVNAGFAEVLGRDAIRLRVIERGAGETLACGSGACAAVAILSRFGLVDERVEVFLPGGRLVIKWPGNGAPVAMKGPAEHVFRGIMNE